MFLLSVLLFPLLSTAAPSGHRDDHAHTVSKRLPSTWFHRSDHPVHELFGRGAATDGATYAQVGSPTWAAAYPESTPDSKAMPSKWLDALNAAVAAGSIPDIPASTNLPNQNPTYPSGFDPNGAVVCSATYKCRNPGDIWDAPDSHIGISFDDGPQPASDKLLKFLGDNNETATHFMIGVNIVQNPNEFLAAFNMGGDIAVHTWTHPYMTTLSNENVVAQLGYTSQIIHDSTGGRVPKFWRPPFGDSDNRIRAIAKEVFGMSTVIWNQDTEDWSLTTGGTTAQIINASMTEWITGPKSPGLIILEHELSDQSVAAFMSAYPLMKSNKWTTASVAQIVDGTSAYQNSASSSAAVALSDILASNSSNSSTTASASVSSSGSSGASSGASAASKQSSSQVSSSTGSGSATSPSTSPSDKPSGALTNSRMMNPAALLCILATFMLRA
ncbi:carbohydrate esterase family 4 protein [Mycena albidolilacea]|uniref:chitin deacetylase n=1 Tax=Mycena albidolilacea TaxID=1033008 RepID=A0AAD7F716_9AGAR|nr:carbohydrate esterase family 4 protein [Mycena albidolilacea]